MASGNITLRWNVPKAPESFNIYHAVTPFDKNNLPAPAMTAVNASIRQVRHFNQDDTQDHYYRVASVKRGRLFVSNLFKVAKRFTDAEFLNVSDQISIFVQKDNQEGFADTDEVIIEALIEQNGTAHIFNETYRLRQSNQNTDDVSADFYTVSGVPPVYNTVGIYLPANTRGRFKLTFNPPQTNLRAVKDINVGPESIDSTVYEFNLKGVEQ